MKKTLLMTYLSISSLGLISFKSGDPDKLQNIKLSLSIPLQNFYPLPERVQSLENTESFEEVQLSSGFKGPKPLNCFFLMSRSEEKSSLNTHQCTLTEKSTNQPIEFEYLSNGISGEDLKTLELPHSNGKKIFILGMHAKNPLACQNFKNYRMVDFTAHILAVHSIENLAKGSHLLLPKSYSFSALKKLSHCQGKDLYFLKKQDLSSTLPQLTLSLEKFDEFNPLTPFKKKKDSIFHTTLKINSILESHLFNEKKSFLERKIASIKKDIPLNIFKQKNSSAKKEFFTAKLIKINAENNLCSKPSDPSQKILLSNEKNENYFFTQIRQFEYSINNKNSIKKPSLLSPKFSEKKYQLYYSQQCQDIYTFTKNKFLFLYSKGTQDKSLKKIGEINLKINRNLDLKNMLASNTSKKDEPFESIEKASALDQSLLTHRIPLNPNKISQKDGIFLRLISSQNFRNSLSENKLNVYHSKASQSGFISQ